MTNLIGVGHTAFSLFLFFEVLLTFFSGGK